MLENGRLYSLRKDGSKDSLYLNIMNKRFLFGSSEYCTVRVYIDGIFPEHCVLTIEDQGKVYLEPLHPSALTLVNGVKIKHKVCLEDNDIVTILRKEFRFAYPSNSSSKHVSFERLILPYSKQMKPAQKSVILTLRKSWKTDHPCRESTVANINCFLKKQICIIKSDIFEKEGMKVPVNILCEKMNVLEVSSCFDKSLIKYSSQYVKESPEERKTLALKMYEFISFLRGLLNMNEEYLFDLCPILEFVWKYCISRASEDILFLPLKSLNIKREITVHKKFLQSRILSCPSENLSPISDTLSEKENPNIDGLEVSVSSNCKMDEQKQNHNASRKISISYKKRVSLAVKRYHLRKRKSIMLAKAAEIEGVENLELSGERPQMKRKRGKEKLQDKGDLKIKEQEISVEVVKTFVGKLNATSEQTKEKRRNKKAAAKKTDLKPGKENIAKLTGISSGNQVTISNLREQTLSKEKQNSKNKGLKQEFEKESLEYSSGEQTPNMKLTEAKTSIQSYKRKKKEAITNKASKSTQEYDTQEISRCQRITRSMAKKRL